MARKYDVSEMGLEFFQVVGLRELKESCNSREDGTRDVLVD
jgi:hypothetical protein